MASSIFYGFITRGRGRLAHNGAQANTKIGGKNQNEIIMKGCTKKFEPNGFLEAVPWLPPKEKVL